MQETELAAIYTSEFLFCTEKWLLNISIAKVIKWCRLQLMAQKVCFVKE